MLAQNFKTAAELDITEAEHGALIKVLGMLERGELKDVSEFSHGDNLFNMNSCGQGCGTPACIGGWVAALMNGGPISRDEQDEYVCNGRSQILHDLYWDSEAIGNNETDHIATVAEAAIAVRSFLTTGDAKWEEALA